MKLQQGQVWRLDDQFFRIVRLERLSVEYKQMKDLYTKAGRQQEVTKKQFCNLIKKATLMTAEEVRDAAGFPVASGFAGVANPAPEAPPAPKPD